MRLKEKKKVGIPIDEVRRGGVSELQSRPDDLLLYGDDAGASGALVNPRRLDDLVLIVLVVVMVVVMVRLVHRLIMVVMMVVSVMVRLRVRGRRRRGRGHTTSAPWTRRRVVPFGATLHHRRAVHFSLHCYSLNLFFLRLFLLILFVLFRCLSLLALYRRRLLTAANILSVLTEPHCFMFNVTWLLDLLFYFIFSLFVHPHEIAIPDLRLLLRYNLYVYPDDLFKFNFKTFEWNIFSILLAGKFSLQTLPIDEAFEKKTVFKLNFLYFPSLDFER